MLLDVRTVCGRNERASFDMKAVVIDESTQDRALVYRDVPDPVPAATDLLVVVKAAALNRADLRRAASHFAGSEQQRALPIAGLELAGEVLAVGDDVRGFAPGDRVMAMAGGAYAERALIDYRLAIPVPKSFDWQQAAATPITFVTAFDALVNAAELTKGESVLVQGASTGAGIAAVQIARLKGASRVFGTASAGKLDRLRELGCDVPIDYRAQDFVEVVQRETDSRGADIVIDHVGSDAVRRNIDAAAIKARIVCVGRVAGVESTLNIDELARKRIHLIGVTFRTRTMDERIKVIRDFSAELLPELERGRVRPVIDSVYPLSEAAAAQEHMRANRHFGKIVLIP
jgi:putative PIG3 family NAD(P)H quinone oxidoreductase